MPFVYNFPFFTIFVCMISGIVTPLLKNGKAAYRLSLFASSVGTALSAALLLRVAPNGESFSYMMGHFPAPWGNELSVGPMEALLATAICFVMLMALLGGRKDLFEDVLPEKQKFLFIMMDLNLAALLALTYTNDIFTSYAVSSVIDLDTIMPGLSLYDFGDSIRFGAATAAEDEPDTSKMELDLHLFEVYTRGYLEAATALTEKEVQMLPMGALVVTLELASRFLKDYLDGDLYFNIKYPDHNLVRTRCQIALAKDMLKKMPQMEQIVRDCVAAAK